MTEPADIAAFRAEVRAFLVAELTDDLRRAVLDHRSPGKDDFLRWQEILFRKGWLAPSWPVEWGGTGWDALHRHVFDEECALAGAPEVPPFGIRMVAPVLMRYGSAAQCERYLPRILDGRDWWCQGYSEPGAGSDLASLKTKAVIDGDHFVIDGQKTWTTYAQHASMMFCLVRTDPAAKAQRGISFLLIDMTAPGVTVEPIRTLDGGHEINEVFFDAVKVPIGNLVGELHGGWTCAKYLLSHERTGAARVGRAKREMAFLRDHAAQRTVDGRRLIDDPTVAREIARLEVDLLALEHTNLRLLPLISGERGHGGEASILKLMGTSVAQAIVEESTRCLGVHAQADPLAAFSLNLRKISIYGGSDEVQKNIIAKTALGL